MATVLKSKQFTEGMNVASVEVFNWEDVASRAREYLDTIREHAGELVAQAKADCEKIRLTAREEGRAAAQGDIASTAQNLAQTLADERVTRATQNINQLAQQLEHTTQQWLRQWQHETVPLAIAIAERLVRRQLDLDPSILLQWLQDSIRLVHGSHTVEVRMHPIDVELLGVSLTKTIDQMSQQVPLKLICDEAIEQRGIVVRTSETEIDQQLSVQIARLSEELI